MGRLLQFGLADFVDAAADIAIAAVTVGDEVFGQCRIHRRTVSQMFDVAVRRKY